MTNQPTGDELYQRMLYWRNIETPCKVCGGSGWRSYSGTSTWAGGIGGQQITNDVCDNCWGTGDELHHGANLKKVRSELAARNLEVKALREALKLNYQALNAIYLLQSSGGFSVQDKDYLVIADAAIALDVARAALKDHPEVGK